MRIDEAQQVIRNETLATGGRTLVAGLQSGIVSGGETEGPSGPRRPILPFFSVLLFGVDGGWRAARGLDSSAPPEHPSVRYVRVIYFAIALNWIIDVLGIAYLFHTYFVAWQTWAQWGTSLVLALVLSSGFAAFAVSLVGKPLRKPYPPSMRRWVSATFAVVAACFVALIVAASVFDTERIPALAFLVQLSWVGLVVGAFVSLALWFGVIDALYLASRVAVMVTVGYLVASPLHEAMFEHEIEDSFYGRHVAMLDGALGELEKQEGTDSEQSLESCLRRNKSSLDDLEVRTKAKVEECSKLEHEAEEADLSASAYDLIAADEAAGKQNEAERKELIDRSREKGFSKIGLVLSTRPGKPTEGPRYQQYKKDAQSARARGTALRKQLASCTEDRSSLQDKRTALLDDCNAESIEDSGLRTKQHRELAEQRERYESRDPALLGALDRALELERIIEGAGTSANDRTERSIDRSRAVIQSKLFAAWVFAFVMPLIVVTMKITGGERLEPYLHRRWKGN